MSRYRGLIIFVTILISILYTIIQAYNLHQARVSIIELEARTAALELRMEFHDKVSEQQLEELTKHITSVQWNKPTVDPKVTIEPWLQNVIISMRKQILVLEKFRLRVESSHDPSPDYVSYSGSDSISRRIIHPNVPAN